MSAYQQIANTIWNTAEILHFQFNKTEYKDVILPFTVLKRLDTVLEPTKDKVIEKFNELDGRVESLGMLTRITGYKFYNTSPFTFRKLRCFCRRRGDNLCGRHSNPRDRWLG